MKTWNILYQRFGEFSYTPGQPVAEWTGQVDLSEQKACSLSSDDFRTVYVDRYYVKSVDLPEGLTPSDFCGSSSFSSRLRGLLAYYPRFEGDIDWPASWWRGLASQENAGDLANLLARKPRKDFWKSLQRQLVEWLDTEPEARQYPTPLSPKQTASLFRNCNFKQFRNR